MDAIVNHCAKLGQAETERYLATLSGRIRAEKAHLAYDIVAPCPCCKRVRADYHAGHFHDSHPMEPYGDPRWEYDPTPYEARTLQ